jgi:murein DD-endopeptidase MepM/ murein hydrolase activator NlpD
MAYLMSNPPNPRPHGALRRALAVVLAVGLLAAAAPGVWADKRKDLESASHRSQRLERLAHEEQAAATRVRDELNVLAGQIEAARSALDRVKTKVRVLREQIRVRRARMHRLQDRLNERAAQVFMMGPGSQLEVFLFASSPSDALDRLTFVGAVSDRDMELSSRIAEVAAELAEDKAVLDVLLAERQELVAELTARNEELRLKLAEQERRIGRLERLHDEAAVLVQRLTTEIRAELLARGGDGIIGPLSVCPIDGPTAYGDTFGIMHHHPGWSHIHKGNDMMATLGTPVVAPFDGVVTQSSHVNAGMYVTVRGEEGFVYMMHLSRFGASGTVETGDVVGYVGTTGNASGPHVHFEWHPGNGVAVDPYPQLNEVC